MRDIYKDNHYFDNYIESTIGAINKQEQLLNENKIRPDRISSSEKNLSEKYLNLLRAKYSRGDEMNDETVHEYYHSIANLMQRYWSPDHLNKIKFVKSNKVVELDQYTLSGYLNILDVLSLGVLLEVPTKDFELIVNFIDNDKVKDHLFEFLISYRIAERDEIHEESYTDDNYMHINQRFQELKDVIRNESNEIIERYLLKFLSDKWYASLKDTGLYNQHKSQFDVYSGYWCFVVAAIVKIRNLDDSRFKNNDYYPKDLI